MLVVALHRGILSRNSQVGERCNFFLSSLRTALVVAVPGAVHATKAVFPLQRGAERQLPLG